jgi:2-haloacid dehalogenase
MLKVVLWDIDGTLLDFKAAERVAIRRCFADFSLGECTDEMLAEYSRVNVKYWEMMERGEISKPALLVGRFREFFSSAGIDPGVSEEFNEAYQRALGDGATFFEGARETVEALKGRVIQAAVTNGTKVAQDGKLRHTGLDKLLDKVYISEVLGYEKPDRRFFDKVFADLGDGSLPFGGYEREEILMVGDSLTGDIKGANNAGIPVCWFNPEHKPLTAGLSADWEAERVEDILRLPVMEGVI